MKEEKMKQSDRSSVYLISILQVFGILGLSLFVTLSRAEEASVEALKAGIEGVYVLTEWHRNGEVLHPPLIDGRAVLLNNRLMFIVHDRAQEANKMSIAGYAIYIGTREVLV
jgi:hypothetical protein